MAGGIPGGIGALQAWLDAQPPMPTLAEKAAEWRAQAEAQGADYGARQARGLSALQRRLLVDLRGRYDKAIPQQEQLRAKGDRQAGMVGGASYRRGADWRDLRPAARGRWSRGQPHKTGADRAAVSRAWRRLEQRGLVERNNDAIAWDTHPRTRSLALTPVGWAATDHLTGHQPTVNTETNAPVLTVGAGGA